MAKKTLLEIVQDVLSDIDSDNVNSITDTVESTQVAFIVRSVYEDMIANRIIPEHYELFQLTALANTAKPNYMKIPTSVTKMEWIKYNNVTTSDTRVNYEEVKYLTPNDFLIKTSTRDSSESNIDSITDFSSVTLLIQNDKKPEYYTSFDDEYLVFDSYDSSVDTTLQASKTMSWGVIEPTFSLSNSYTPDIDSNLFPLLINEVKSLAFFNLKQAANAKVEQKVRQDKVRIQNNKHRIEKENHSTTPNFGRK